VTLSLFLIHPDWLELVLGILVPRPLHYPDWVTVATLPGIASRPEWVEAATYVGIIGGSSYDYLAYISYAREKGWVPSRGAVVAARPGEVTAMTAMTVDCAVSFCAVLVFTVVFVACGTTLLAPKHLVPDGTNLLALQASFVGHISSALTPLYFAGALLTIGGTLYGTIEVAPTVLREFVLAMRSDTKTPDSKGEWCPGRLRHWAILWSAGGGLCVLGMMVWTALHGAMGQPPGLIALLTPANLFTGVLGCGIVCWLNVWMDRRYLPAQQRPSFWLTLLNLVAGGVLVWLGLKGYWDHSGPRAYAMLAGTVGLGWVFAWLMGRGPERSRPGEG